MELNGSHTIDEQRDRLWDLLFEPETLEATIPGAKEFERDGDSYSGVIERGLAGISVSLSVDVDVVEKDKPVSAVAEIEGSDNTINSRVDGTMSATFEEVDDGTKLVYDAEFNLSGKMASLGSRIIKRKVNKDINTFFSNLEEYVEAQEASA